ncbi:MAG TPA: urease accessory UreF family protein [Kofleriaceae bacterium]|nr:urease accessory UreF family protein [Kofleriaceae bacterium]
MSAGANDGGGGGGMAGRWRLVQLADSGFPAGGFAHSGGLEAAVALGRVRGEGAVVAFATAAMWQAGTFALPYVREAQASAGDARDAADDTCDVATLDARCDRAQSGHVTRRASRAQGRAWMRACSEVFGAELGANAAAPVPAAALPFGHWPVAFGVTVGALGVEREDALALYLQIVARGILSAAVRLGELGPSAAQRAQDRMATVAREVIAQCGERAVADAAHSAPVEELYANLHDTLPARLFQS